MPIVSKTKQVQATAQNVATNSQMESAKVPGSNFAEGGLNDGTVNFAALREPTFTSVQSEAVTPQEQAKLTVDTLKLESTTNKTFAQQQTKVNTYGLVPFAVDQVLPGQEPIAEYCKAKMWNAIVEHNWYAFFTKLADGCRVADQEKLQNFLNIATRHDYKLLVSKYGYGTIDIATHMSVLALVDSVLLADNSGSMQCTDASHCGDSPITRWEYLKLVAQDDGFISGIFDSNGYGLDLLEKDNRIKEACRQPSGQYHIREGKYILPDPRNPEYYATMHDDFSGFVGLTSQEQTALIFNVLTPSHSTPTADAIERIYNRDVKMQAINGILEKPVVVKLYTDGIPNSGQNVINTIRKIKRELRNTVYGDHAMLFQINQTGREPSVNRWFEELDKDEELDIAGKPKEPNNGVGDIIDCVSDFELELAEVLTKNPGSTFFDVPFYKIKCRCGVLIKALDKTDEQNVTSVFASGGKLFGLF